jgi:hypothetical protein
VPLPLPSFSVCCQILFPACTRSQLKCHIFCEGLEAGMQEGTEEWREGSMMMMMIMMLMYDAMAMTRG